MKLNRVLLNQRKSAITKNEITGSCPFCNGRNPHCAFFGVTDPLGTDPALELNVEKESPYCEARVELLKKVQQRLKGRMIAARINDAEYRFDLGANLALAYRYPEPFRSCAEMPVLVAIGIGNDPEGKLLNKWFIFPSMVLQIPNLEAIRLDGATQDTIRNMIRDEMAKFDYYPEIVGTLVCLNGNEIVDPTVTDSLPNAVEWLDKSWLCRLEEIIYQRFADIEERMLRQVDHHDSQGFLCSDLKPLRQALHRELADSFAALRNKLGKEAGYRNEQLLPD